MNELGRHREALFWFALCLQAIGAFVYFVYADGSGSAAIFYALTKVLMLFIPLLWIVLGGTLPKIWKISGTWLGFSTGFVFAGLLVLSYWLLQDVVMDAQEAIALKIGDFGISSFLLFAIFFSTVHSLFEEYYWRWFALSAGKRIVGDSSAMVTSIAFGIHHSIILSQLFPFWFAVVGGGMTAIAGWIWCRMTTRSGSLFPAWISHVFADAAIMFIGWQLL